MTMILTMTANTATPATSSGCTSPVLMICVTQEAAVFTGTARLYVRIAGAKENYEQTQRMETPDQRHAVIRRRQAKGVRRA